MLEFTDFYHPSHQAGVTMLSSRTFEPLNQLVLYIHENPSEISVLDPIASLLTQGASLTSRKSSPAHITASAISAKEGAILLVKHRILGKWLQPGGHIEQGENPIQAALREITEETGLSSTVHPWHCEHPFPIDINVHEIPANEEKNESAHLHVDFRYLIRTDTSIKSPEMEWEHRAFSCIAEHNLRLLIRKIERITAMNRMRYEQELLCRYLAANARRYRIRRHRHSPGSHCGRIRPCCE